MRKFLMGATAATSLLSGAAAAQESVADLPLVAAGMSWEVEPESCAVETGVEGSSMYEHLGLTVREHGGAIDGLHLELLESQRRVPKRIAVAANGLEPFYLDVEIPEYGPANTYAVDFEERPAFIDKMIAGETVIVFTAFENISLSPFGLAEAVAAKPACLREKYAGVGFDPTVNDGIVTSSNFTEDLSGIFSSDDYPSQALRFEQQGDVRAIVLIDERGRVEDCRIDSSSGVTIIDRKTCDVIESRLKTEPARDAAGNAVPSIELAPLIRWQIPTRRKTKEDD